jgi:hypothetical protein
MKNCYTETTNLLQFKIHIRKSHRKLICTLRLEGKDRVFFFSVDLHFFNAGSNIQNASE